MECCTKEILESPGALTKGLDKIKRDLKLEVKEIFKVH